MHSVCSRTRVFLNSGRCFFAMSVRSDRTFTNVPQPMDAIGDAFDTSVLQAPPQASAGANPLNRRLHVSIRSTLNDLCLQRNKGVWQPNASTIKSIMQQTQFTSLDGSADRFGDMSSVVLHDLSVSDLTSTFPLSVGASITAVDNSTWTKTGQSFALVVPPNGQQQAARSLQKDDTCLAYEFASKFPGYTATNLTRAGVHEVQNKGFVLIDRNHPVVTAISENAHKLQIGDDMAIMPEGLVKISSKLYEHVLPSVQAQVESQIKVRDFSQCNVSLHPAEFSSWTEARDAMMVERKAPVKAAYEQAVAANPEKEHELRTTFAQQQKDIERAIDYSPMEFHMSMDVSYNFLSDGRESN